MLSDPEIGVIVIFSMPVTAALSAAVVSSAALLAPSASAATVQPSVPLRAPLVAAPAADGSTTMQVPATADATVFAGAPNTNYGTSSVLTARSYPKRASLLHFAFQLPAGQTVTAAQLLLKVTSTTASKVAVAPTSPLWNERTVTWNNAPAAGPTVARSGAYTAGQWLALDVSPVATRSTGSLDLRIDGGTNTWTSFASREGRAGDAPKLVVTTAPTQATPAPTPTPTPTPTPAPGTGVPTTDLPNWKLVSTEDFNGSSLPKGWGAYTGQPGGNPGGWWDPSHAVVSNGNLVLRGYRDGAHWATGGVMLWAPQTYGKYEVRFKMDAGKGVKYALLMWPSSGRWPTDGEIDFLEDGGGDRSSTTATLHYGANNSTIQRSVATDFTQWHTVGVEWSPGSLVYTLDGKPWGSVATSQVPSTPMNLALQTEAGTCGDKWTPCPDASTPTEVDAQIDWVARYAQR